MTPQSPTGRDGYKSGQIHMDRIWFLLTQAYQLKEDCTIGYESFQYRHWLPNAVLTPVEVIGIVKEFARQHPSVFLMSQTPSQRMYFTDQKLKDRGLYRPGKPHANDAMRHLLVYLDEF